MNYSYDRMADDIAVIQALELEEVTLGGFSVGGAISVRYMARHSGYKVAKLVLIGAAAPSCTQQTHNPYGSTIEEVNVTLAATSIDRPKMIAG